MKSHRPLRALMLGLLAAAVSFSSAPAAPILFQLSADVTLTRPARSS